MNRDILYHTLMGNIVNFYCNIFGFGGKNLKNTLNVPNNNLKGYDTLALLILK